MILATNSYPTQHQAFTLNTNFDAVVPDPCNITPTGSFAQTGVIGQQYVFQVPAGQSKTATSTYTPF